MARKFLDPNSIFQIEVRVSCEHRSKILANSGWRGAWESESVNSQLEGVQNLFPGGKKSLESKFSSTNTSSFRSTRWLCRRTSPTRASRPDPGSSRSRLSSSVSIPSSTDSTPCLSSSPLQSRWENLLCFNQNYLPFIPKVHEAWESGNWRDPWESLDK